MQNISIWAAVIDMDCSADDLTAHLACPRRDTGAPLRYLVTSRTSCCRSATARPPWPSCAAGEPDWLLSSFIYDIKDALRIGRGQIPEGARSASPGLL